MALAEELKTSVEIEGIKVKPRSVLASGSRRCSHILEENLKEFGVLFFYVWAIFWEVVFHTYLSLYQDISLPNIMLQCTWLERSVTVMMSFSRNIWSFSRKDRGEGTNVIKLYTHSLLALPQFSEQSWKQKWKVSPFYKGAPRGWLHSQIVLMSVSDSQSHGLDHGTCCSIALLCTRGCRGWIRW